MTHLEIAFDSVTLTILIEAEMLEEITCKNVRIKIICYRWMCRQMAPSSENQGIPHVY